MLLAFAGHSLAPKARRPATHGGPDSSKIGDVRSSRKPDEIFLDDTDPPVIAQTSSPVDALQFATMKHVRNVDQHRWQSFDSWTANEVGEHALPPNRWSHHVWNGRIEAFRCLVEEHPESFKNFILRCRQPSPRRTRRT